MADVSINVVGVSATGYVNINLFPMSEGTLLGFSAFDELNTQTSYVRPLVVVANSAINAVGVSGMGAVSPVVVTTDANIDTLGVAGTASVGGVDVPIYVTGVSATTYVNINLFPMSEGTLLGFSAFDELNTQTSYVRPLVVTADGVVNALNVSGTGAVGSVVVSAGAVVDVSGVYGTGLTHDVEIPTHVAGVYGTGEVGAVDVAADANADVFSIYATGVVGVVDVAADANIDAVGVSTEGLVGGVDVPTYVTGVYSAGAVGSVDISADANVIPLGVFATGQVKSVRLWSNVDNAVATNWVDIAA